MGLLSTHAPAICRLAAGAVDEDRCLLVTWLKLIDQQMSRSAKIMSPTCVHLISSVGEVDISTRFALVFVRFSRLPYKHLRTTRFS